MEDDAREDPAAPNLEEQVERLRTELGRKKQELERTRKRHDELASLISRRDFLAAGVTAAGTAVLAGLLGYGIRAWTDADEQPILVTAPGPTDQTVDLFVYPRVKVAQLSAVRVGEPVTFEYPLRGKPAMLVKVGSPAKFGIGPDGDLVAFSTLCTHMGCPLEGAYKAETNVLGPCPCHLSTFDLAVGGQVTIGQATEELPQIALAIEEGTIYAEGTLGLVFGQRHNLLDGEKVEVS